MAKNITLDPPQSATDALRKEIADVVLTPNDQLGGREPIVLVNSGDDADRQKLRDLIEAIKHGMFT